MADEQDFDLGVTVRGFSPGEKVFDRYTLQRMLGRGGMGVVWLARDEELQRDVALKFLPEMVAADPTSVDDLKRETSRSLDLTHPHIVRVHDFVTNGTLAAISMEFVSGRTLAELRLQQASRIFDPSGLGAWARELCAALTYAHEDASLVHRDLKPSNLMIDAKRRLKVTDFGIAATVSDTVTRVSRLTSSGGTPAYASPQQIMGEAPSPADDIYSVGATFYELLTSKPPFFSGNLVLQVQSKRPPTLAARRAELGVTGGPIPPEWEEVVAGCLEKDPSARPSSIREIGGRLGFGAALAPPTRGSVDDLDSGVTVPSFNLAAVPAESDRTQPARSATAPVPPPPPPPVRAKPKTAPVPPAPPPPVVATPAATAPVPAAPTPKKPRSRSGKWIALVVILVLIGAGVWLADVPNRLAASSELRKAQQALVTSSLPEAIDHFRQAVLHRPADAQLRQEFENTQEQWLERLRQQTKNLAPHDALAALTDEVRATGSTLTGSHATAYSDLVNQLSSAARGDLVQKLGHVEDIARNGNFNDAFAELERLKPQAAGVPEFAQTETRVREFQARREIEDAKKQANDGNYTAALASLDKVATSGLLLPEVDEARTEVRHAAASGNVERLGRAIRAGRAEDVRAVLETNGVASAGTIDEITKNLLEARTFAAFQDAVRAAGYKPAEGSEVNRPLHILTEMLRDRFSDKANVAKFLAESYAAWGDELLADDQPGFALYALERADLEGGAADEEQENDARAAAAQMLGLKLQLPATEQPSRESAIPTDAVRATLRDIMTRMVGTWMEVIELRPVGERLPPLELRTSVSKITTRDQTSQKTDHVQFQTGSQTLRNPSYAKTAEELRSAEAESADLQRQLQQLKGGNSDGERLIGSLLAIGLQAKADAAKSRVRDLQRKLSQTPQTIQSPTYAQEPYQTVTHDLTYGTSLTARLFRNQDELAPWVIWNAGATHQTREVIGNAAHGVPVEQARYPDLRDVATQLGAALNTAVRHDMASLLNRLEVASFSAVEAQIAADGASATVAVDRRWALGRLWRLSGLSVRQTPELERSVRAQLGLPAIRENLLPSTPATPAVELSTASPSSPSSTPAPLPSQTVVKRSSTAPPPEQSRTPPAPAQPEAPPANTFYYTARQGDTFNRIARRFGVSAAAIRKMNPKLEPGRLNPGTQIVIPRR